MAFLFVDVASDNIVGSRTKAVQFVSLDTDLTVDYYHSLGNAPLFVSFQGLGILESKMHIVSIDELKVTLQKKDTAAVFGTMLLHRRLTPWRS